MSNNFRVGQKVVCVDDTPRAFAISRVRYGRVYTVTSIFDTPAGPGVLLLGLDPTPLMGWFADRFRPAVDRKEDLSIFYKMLEPGRVDA